MNFTQSSDTWKNQSPVPLDKKLRHPKNFHVTTTGNKTACSCVDGFSHRTVWMDVRRFVLFPRKTQFRAACRVCLAWGHDVPKIGSSYPNIDTLRPFMGSLHILNLQMCCVTFKNSGNDAMNCTFHRRGRFFVSLNRLLFRGKLKCGQWIHSWDCSWFFFFIFVLSSSVLCSDFIGIKRKNVYDVGLLWLRNIIEKNKLKPPELIFLNADCLFFYKIMILSKVFVY